ncbi:phage major tail protein, TP901-1 family [Oricola indica]|jgi:TP901-1 family phage major tail protein|uniref:phage major tail protein, TP901-1 family n=1 Tax=Oricola indica TaxID=2872591 RepID=UPI001CBE4B6D|nr:phage major tail protein, TP901-1 family [Oricola indica]
MASQRGKDLLLKFWDGAAFATVAGLRSKRISFNAQSVDITDSQSAGRWRELLDGAGIQRASISAAGIFKDASSDELVRAAFFAGAVTTCQLVIPDFGTIEGGFQITSLDYSGNHDGEVTFDIALESGSELTFGAA